LGIRVLLPKDLICCGGPLLWTGQDEAFSEVSRKNIRVFERVGISTLVTGCAGCGMTLKKGYEGRFEGQKAFIVYDFIEYLEFLKPSFGPERGKKRKVAYHDPCHLRRGQGIWKEPRKLLQSLPEVHLVEIEKPDQCCGGMLATHHRDLANCLSKKKARTIIDAKVDMVTTECPLCKDMISKALKIEGSRITVDTIGELIEKLYCSGRTIP
jgi:fumarate reductase (CoM/CoB) subunit B